MQKTRSEHIAVSDARVEELSKLASAVTMNWDLEIDNEHCASGEEIITAVRSLSGAEEAQ